MTACGSAAYSCNHAFPRTCGASRFGVCARVRLWELVPGGPRDSVSPGVPPPRPRILARARRSAKYFDSRLAPFRVWCSRIRTLIIRLSEPARATKSDPDKCVPVLNVTWSSTGRTCPKWPNNSPTNSWIIVHGVICAMCFCTNRLNFSDS